MSGEELSELPCTYRDCGKPESDPVHPKAGEHMGIGRHVYRHDGAQTEAQAQRAIEAAIEGLSEESRGRVLRYVQWLIEQDDLR